MYADRLKMLNSVLDQHKAVFEGGLGTVEPHRATLHMKPDATSKFHKLCPVSLAIEGVIRQEPDRMNRESNVK